MTPTQRAAALRLAEGPRTSGELWGRAVIALLRELAAEPVQEPAIWIQSNHLQHAKNGPYLARTGPTKLMSDFIPLYAAPQQPMRCPTDGGACGAGGYCRPQQRKPLTEEQVYEAISDQVFWATSKNFILRLVRDIEHMHGITGEPT